MSQPISDTKRSLRSKPPLELQILDLRVHLDSIRDQRKDWCNGEYAAKDYNVAELFNKFLIKEKNIS